MRKQQKKQDRALSPVVIVIGVILAGFVGWSLYAFRQSAMNRARHEAQAAPLAAGTRPDVTLLGGKLVFSDVAAQSREFIGYYSSIQLTPQQEAIKREVLASMPAACCSDSNAYTCCCPCNLSKTVWGLSNHVLTHYGASAGELRHVVRAWYAYTNPNGYTGDSCYTGRCDSAPHANGCGGMKESNLVL